MVQEQWLQLKVKFLLGCNMKIVILCREINLYGGGSLLGRIFPGGEQTLVDGWGLSPIPPVEKILLGMARCA